MNHEKHYTSLINKALNRRPQAGTYYERHHILPRSLGGTDAPGNTVFLTIREHFIAHLLLAHMEGYENQWLSVAAILNDTINPHRPGRFQAPKLRWQRWTRRRVAFVTAAMERQRAKARAVNVQSKRLKMLLERFEQELADIDARYAVDFIEAAML